jgi:hypothetical protein
MVGKIDMSEEFEFDEFVQDMQRFEKIFPGVYLEIREIDDGAMYYAKIAGHSTTVSSYQAVKEFFLSFEGQDLPQDPQVIADIESHKNQQ